MAFVYILQSLGTGRYYVGVTRELAQRLAQHRDPANNPCRWTRGGGPWKRVFSMEFSTIRQALRAEKFIKRMKSKSFIEKLVSGERKARRVRQTRLAGIKSFNYVGR